MSADDQQIREIVREELIDVLNEVDHERITELAQAADDDNGTGLLDRISRRQVLTTAGAAIGGGLVGSQTADAAGESYATATGTVGSDSQPIDRANIRDLDAQLLELGEIDNSIRLVPEFGGIQDAHDDLPSRGGKIIVTEDVSETGITLTKPVTIEGVHAQTAAAFDSAVEVDTSGGEGIDNQGELMILRDLHIRGDRNGSFGIRSAPGASRPRVVIDNVVTESNGGDGLILKGALQQCRLDFYSSNNTGNGLTVDVSESGHYFNANFASRVSCLSNDGKGVEFIGGPINGNVISSVDIENNNTSPQFDVSTSGELQGNHWQGYGVENNGTVRIKPASGSANRVRFRSGTPDVDQSVMTRTLINNTDRRVDRSGVKLEKSTQQSISSATLTPVAFENTAFDELGAARVSSNAFQVQASGVYAVKGKVRFASGGSANQGDRCKLIITVNGTAEAVLEFRRPGDFAGSPVITTDLDLAESDTVELRLENEDNSDELASGGSGSYFSIRC